MRWSRVFVALWLSLLVAGNAQQAPQPPRFKSGVEVVQIDVSVLDQARLPIRGLTTADFTILEDGKPQPVVAFKEVNIPAPEAVSASWMRDVAPDVLANGHKEQRMLVLVLDDASMGGDPRHVALEMKSTMTIARSIIDRLGPDDVAAIVYTADNSRARDFTSDHARLLEDISRFRPGWGFTDLGGCLYMRFALDTITDVARSLEDAPGGRKALVYISRGVPIDWAKASAATVMSADNASNCFTSNELMQFHDAIFRSAGRANVNVYGIDPGGLEAPEGAYSSDANGLRVPSDLQGGFDSNKLGREFLKQVSANTGGIAGVDTNDFESNIAEILRDTSSYYLIGYQSTNEKADGRYRKLDVRVNRAGVTVRARTGYDAPRPAKKGKNAPGVSTTAVAGVVPSSDVSMRAVVAPFAIAGSANVALAIAADVRQPSPSERVTESIDLQTNAYGPSGQPHGSQKQTARVVMIPSEDEAQFEIVSRFDLKPGRYNLRLGASSAVQGKSGSVYYAIDVPDFSKDDVSISGVVLSATPAIASAGREALASLIPVMPTTQRTFVKSDEVTAFLRIYQPAKGDLGSVRLDVKVVDDHDVVNFHAGDTLAADQFDATRSVDHRFNLPLADLSPGPHLLTIEATAGKASARRDVRFLMR